MISCMRDSVKIFVWGQSKGVASTSETRVGEQLLQLTSLMQQKQGDYSNCLEGLRGGSARRL